MEKYVVLSSKAHIHACTNYYMYRKNVMWLRDMVTNLTSRPLALPMQSEATCDRQNVETLDIPPAPEILDKADYPSVPYWGESAWTTHTERQRDRGQAVSKLAFLTDKDGNPAVESRIKEFTSHARQAWNELYRHRLEPKSWMKRTPQATKFFAHMMKGKFLEFCYCDGDWKVEHFAIIKYPDWCRDARDPGQLTRVRT
jgi:hypothetical protein